MRIFLGFLVVAVALGDAVWLHGAKLEHVPSRCRSDTTTYDCKRPPIGFGSGTVTVFPAYDRRASWQDPLAIGIAIAGIGAGLAIAVPGFRG